MRVYTKHIFLLVLFSTKNLSVDIMACPKLIRSNFFFSGSLGNDDGLK